MVQKDEKDPKWDEMSDRSYEGENDGGKEEEEKKIEKTNEKGSEEAGNMESREKRYKNYKHNYKKNNYQGKNRYNKYNNYKIRSPDYYFEKCLHPQKENENGQERKKKEGRAPIIVETNDGNRKVIF